MTNQITTQVLCDQSGEPQSDCDWMLEGVEGASKGVVTTALGNTWSHCVSTRMVLQFLERGRRMVREGYREGHVRMVVCTDVMGGGGGGGGQVLVHRCLMVTNSRMTTVLTVKEICF